MTDELQKVMLAQFQGIRAEIAKGTEKTAVLAEGLAGIRRDIEDMRTRMTDMSARFDSIGHAIASMRRDIQAVAIALDGHSARLDRIEQRIGLTEPTH